MKQKIQILIDRAAEFGLSTTDVANAQELLDHYEFALTLELISNQLLEYDIQIDAQFYESVIEMAKKMKMPEAEFVPLYELI